MSASHVQRSVSEYVRPSAASSDQPPLPRSATAKAAAASGSGNSQPTLPPPAQKPCGTCATHVTTSRSPATSPGPDRKSTRLNSSHGYISYAVFCLKKKKTKKTTQHSKKKTKYKTEPN